MSKPFNEPDANSGAVEFGVRPDTQPDIQPGVVLALGSREVREFIFQNLESVYTLTSVDDEQSAHAAVIEQQPEVLIFDELLPGFGAASFLSALQADARTAKIPVIQILTRNGAAEATHGGVRDSDLHEGDEQQAGTSNIEPDAYLSWPLSPRVLVKNISNLGKFARLEQKALQQEASLQAELRRVHENMSESYVAVDSDWHFTYMNAAAERASSLKREEVLGKLFWDIFPDASGTEFELSYQRAMTDRVQARVASQFEHIASWFEADVIPLEDGGLGFYFRDASRVKEDEEAALANERRLRLFLENAKDYALMLLDTESRVLEWMGAAEAITGWTAEERVGKPIDVLFTPEDLAEHRPQREAEMAAGTGRAEDMRWHVRKDGTRFFAEGVLTSFRDSQGNLQGFGKIFRDATMHKLADEALKQSRKQFQLLLDSVAEGICGVDIDGNCIFLNPAGAVMLDYSADELVGQPIRIFTQQQHNDKVSGECKIMRATADGRSLRGDDDIFWRRDKVALPVHYSLNPIITDGITTGAVVAFTDMTERRQAEDALRDSERQLRFVMDSVPQKLFTTTAEGAVSYANPKWLQFSGFPFEQIRDWGWKQLVHPDDLEQTLAAWRKSMASGTPFDFEHRFRGADGLYRWHLSRALPMRDKAGKIIMWVGSNTDIHDVKIAEVALGDKLALEQQNAARLTEVANVSRAVNSVLSLENIARILAEESRRILRTHQTLVSLSGKDRTPLIDAVSSSERFADDQHDEFRPDGLGIYNEFFSGCEAVRLTQDEFERHPAWRAFERHYGDRPPMRGWLAVPLIDHEGKNLGLMQATDKLEGDFSQEDEAILQQLAAIASVSIENAKLYDSLREQDRRKDEFLATLAHELRNPLAPLRTGLDLLAVPGSIDQSSRIRDMMQRQLAHMVRLIDDLMDVSRVSSGKVELKRERVALQNIVDSALEVIEPMISAAQHQIRIQLPQYPLYIQGDPTRLAQVVSNLLHNAAKYTPPGGRIELIAEQEADQVVIQIIDSGIGITEDMLPKVFDIFTQAGPGIDRAQGGLGIGLSLVQKLVELHRGSVSADSPGLGEGSVFTLRLPLLWDDPPLQKTPAKSDAPVKLAAKRILVVDDNVDAAEALAMLLRFSGHEVVTAHSGNEALGVAVDFNPDAVFLDLGLPGLNGYEVATSLRKESSLSNLILIALTGWGSEEDRRRSTEVGFDFHLVKPVDAETVTITLERFFPPHPIDQ